jgi:hypothetical protein
MAKKVDNSVLDAALNEIKTKVNKMTVCSAEPSDFTAANNGGGVFLGDVAMAAGDFTIADGDTSGRKCTVAQKAGVNVDATGTATHVALLNTLSNTLLYVTTSTSLALTSGSSLTFGAWDIEIADPS